MNYHQALAWMYERIPMYQRQGRAAYKGDLSRTRALDAHMNHPHRAFRSIHVGGTNGKGSVAHMLAAVLQTAGYRVGLYTSPHLKDFRERIRVNGQMVDQAFVARFIGDHRDRFQQIAPSFFELSVVMAFEYFRQQQVDVAVVEVGLGGRLDSTNVVDPLISVITNISLDHTQFLGHTPEEIAREKAGIIKPARPVVVGEYDRQTASVFQQKAASSQSPLWFADQQYQIYPADEQERNITFPCYSVFSGHREVYARLCTDMAGPYQATNLITALRVLDVLHDLDIVFSGEHIARGLANVSGITGFKGRWFILQKNPLVICDTAHNQAGLKVNIQQVERIRQGTLHFVLSFVNDKQLDAILQLFPPSECYYFTRSSIERALDENTLAQTALRYGLEGEAFADPHRALQQARENASPEDLIYVGGSTFLVSELI